MITLSHFAQIISRCLGQLKRTFVFSLGQNDRSNRYFSFGHLRVQYLKGGIRKASARTGKSFLLNLNFALHSASLMSDPNQSYYTHRMETQARNLNIAIQVSVVVKDEEKAELFNRSHATTKNKVQQITRRSRKGRSSSES